MKKRRKLELKLNFDGFDWNWRRHLVVGQEWFLNLVEQVAAIDAEFVILSTQTKKGRGFKFPTNIKS